MTYIYQDKIKPKSNTALIMCTYIRLTNMPKLLQKIQLQNNKDFDFYIVNNAVDQDFKLTGYFKKYGENLGVNVFIKNYENKYKQFARFYLAKELAEQGYEKIIFVDDDEVLPNSFIQDCHTQYDEKYVKSFYAHKFEKDYWKKVRLRPREIGNYAGTGGLICSSKIFLEDKLFQCPEEYHIIDDLWFSHYILKFTDYKITLLDTQIQFIKDDKATFVNLIELKRNFSTEYIIDHA
jgi:hypothetical protein